MIFHTQESSEMPPTSPSFIGQRTNSVQTLHCNQTVSVVEILPGYFVYLFTDASGYDWSSV